MNSHQQPLMMHIAIALAILCSIAAAQQVAPISSPTVPRLVNFAGKAIDAEGKTLTGTLGATFAIYKDQSESAALWIETQNIQADAKGNYSVKLGATKPEGLPLDMFNSGEARWLGVTVNGGAEQPRVLLLSVPYALQAADAQTFGGLPPSAFVLATSLNNNYPAASTAAGTVITQSAPPSVSGTGTTDFVPLWTNGSGALGNSALFQSGTGSTAKIGINTTSPAATLDIQGAENVRGTLTLPATGGATAGAGKNSQPLNLAASSFSSSTSTAVPQTFQWQAEAAGNNTPAPSGTLNLLYGKGTLKPAETGLKIGSNGHITFAAGQVFPGTGNGSVTSVGLSAPASDFTVSGSPITTSGTLVVNWKNAPTSADTANAIVKRDSTGAFQAGPITATTSNLIAVIGQSTSGLGVGGFSSTGTGVQGSSNAGAGISGESSTNYGVAGNSGSNLGVFGNSTSSDGVLGQSQSGYGVYGVSFGNAGVVGVSDGTAPTSTGYGPDGVVGLAQSAVGTGVVALNNSNGDSLLAVNQSGGWAGVFVGDVDVVGNLSKSGGSFKIDHPLDPANKYLYHSFVESPDMMNIYNGEVTLDENGQATVNLPDWFESLNQDFRYQLTAIGAPGPNLHIREKVHDNSFKIAGGQPGMEVSWQVTGIRHDAWANAHRIPVEVEKTGGERGLYIHPELFGASKTKSVASARHPAINRLPKVGAAVPIQ